MMLAHHTWMLVTALLSLKKPWDYHTVHVEKNSLEKFSTGNSYFDFNNFPPAQDAVIYYSLLPLTYAMLT